MPCFIRNIVSFISKLQLCLRQLIVLLVRDREIYFQDQQLVKTDNLRYGSGHCLLNGAGQTPSLNLKRNVQPKKHLSRIEPCVRESRSWVHYPCAVQAEDVRMVQSNIGIWTLFPWPDLTEELRCSLNRPLYALVSPSLYIQTELKSVVSHTH